MRPPHFWRGSADPVLTWRDQAEGQERHDPILTLAAGVVLGALGVRYALQRDANSAIRSGKEAGTALLRGGIDRAGGQSRGAAISGLAAVETQSCALRQRLEGVPAAEPKPARPAKRATRTAKAGAGGAETPPA